MLPIVLRSGGTLLLLAALATAPELARADDWPQWLGPKRDGVWREKGILQKFPKGGPKILWRKPIGGGYMGPAVAQGQVYVMDRKPVQQGVPKKERVLCFNSTDGKLLWKHEYDCKYAISYPVGPRATPLVHQGKVYTLGAMGHLFCLDAAKGTVRWSKDFAKEYKARPPVWGWSASPLLDGNKLICLVGGKGSVVVAFDKDSGQEKWKALTAAEIGYSSPVIFKAGGKRQLIVWHSEAVNSLDPDTGTKYWSVLYPHLPKLKGQPAVQIATPRKEGDMLFFTSFYYGPLLLKLDAEKPAATVLWRGKIKIPGKDRDGLHAINTTPVFKDGYIYGIGGGGELQCIQAKTNKEQWQTYAAIAGLKSEEKPKKPAFCATAFLIRHGDRYFLFNDQGDLIIARLTPKKYEEIDRANILEPTGFAMGRKVVWSHPAFANRCMFARNDKKIVCVSLAEPRKGKG
jgi:outer membrane protein assembly factor BamB